MKNSEIIQRYNSLKSQRKTVEETWEVIKRYVVPYRGEFFKEQNSEHSVEWRKNREVYDSTAPDAANTLASSIHWALTNPALQWFKLTFRDKALNTDVDAKAWLEDSATRIFQALQESNFNLETAECYLDLTTFGSSIVLQEVQEENGQFDEFVFKAVPVEDCYFEQDHNGDVCVFYQKIMWTPLQIMKKFGDECPHWVKERAKLPNQNDSKLEVVFCIYPREKGGYVEPKSLGQRIAPVKRKYGFKYLVLNVQDAGTSGNQLGKAGGYYEMPAYVPRWRKTSGSMWGNSPAMIALPDILTLNTMVELILKSAEKVVDPPWATTERGLMSDLNLQPSGLTVMRSLDQIKPLESGARFDVSSMERQKLEEKIQAIFLIDKLELKNSPAMTATEVNVRYELMQRILGPTAGRIISDYIQPLIERSFRSLFRSSMLMELPESAMGAEIDIVYTGPMMRSQRSDEMQQVEQWLAGALQIAEVDDRVLKIIDFEELVRGQAEERNVPARYMKSKKVVEREAKAERAAANQERDLAMATAEGQAMKAQGEGEQAMIEAENAGIQ